MRRTSILTAGLAAGLVVLGACGSDEGERSGARADSTPGTSAAGEAVLATAESDLGTIVVDADGRTVYVFDKDTPGSGESSCTGDCLAAWPPVTTDSDSPAAEGVTGEIGTIARDDGTSQVTLDGWPLYLWHEDQAPGDTNGQGVQDVWWVVAPDGTKITEPAAPADVPGY
jgi:predicted lipoprotein with Yx(FWY)xxD motif